MTAVGVLLAAGQSRRFGPGDKLLADLGGRPLVTHAAAALTHTGCDKLIAVTSNPAVADVLSGFEHVEPDRPDDGQSASLRAGVRRASQEGAKCVLVALGDMPFVTPETLARALAMGQRHGVAMATDGTCRMPPICFGHSLFSSILELTGDQGARAILRTLPSEAKVLISTQELRDIDTSEDMAAARLDFC